MRASKVFFNWLASSQVRTYNIPSAFSTVFTSEISRTGDVLSTTYDFDVPKNAVTGNACYVDFVGGNNANSGTEGSPFQTLAFARTQAFNIIYLKRDVWHQVTADLDLGSKDWKLLPYGSGANPKIASFVSGLSFSQNGTHATVYEASSAVAITSVIDGTYVDSDGDPIVLTRVTSLVNCAALANSYYYDAGGTTLYVRLNDSRAPDASVRCFRSVRVTRMSSTLAADRYFYAEDIDFFGGEPLTIANTSGAGAYLYGFNRCKFNYAGVKDGVMITGRSRGYFKECSAKYNVGDGFNYNSTPGPSFAFEWYCTGGWNVQNDINANANNGSTGHSNHKVISVGGNYRYSAGKGVQYINDSDAMFIRAQSGFSIGSGANTYAYAPNSSTGATELWLIECQGVGPELRGYDNFNNSTLYLYDGDYGNINSLTNRDQVGGVKNNLTEGDVYQ